MDKKNYCRTAPKHGPRGDYYSWCRYLENDTLEFGEEQGNYAGGTTLSYRFYGLHEYPVGHVPGEAYWEVVKKRLERFKDEEPEFYEEIVEILARNHSNILTRINE